MTTACVVGSTGLVGSNILSTLLSLPAFEKVHAYTRRELKTDIKLTEIKSSDTTTWPASYPSQASVFFSGLGSTRASAGGLANQRKIDLDLNVDLARAAKAAGTKVYVLISSGSASSSSLFPYLKMKGELEDAVIGLGFDHCIIVRPGLLVGHRQQSRFGENAFQQIARAAGSISPSLQDFWAQDSEVVGRAAVAASQRVLDGSEQRKIWYVNQSDIVRLGRTTWSGSS